MTFVLSACRYLPYNKDIELAMATIPKLKLEATINQVSIPNLCFSSNSSDRLFFIPDKASYSSGFIVRWNDSGNADFWYYANDGVSNSAIGPRPIHVNGASPYKPNVFAETISVTSPATTNGYLLYLSYDYDSSSKQTVAFKILHYTPPPVQLLFETGVDDFSASIGGTVAAVNSAFINPIDNRFYVLCTENSPGLHYSEVVSPINVDGSGLGPWTPTRSVNASPTPVLNDFFYSYDIASNKSVISYATSAGFQSFWWNNTTNAAFPADRPPLKILSNSNLLSADANMIYGYDLNGNYLYKFPTGALRYVFEKKDATGEFVMVFSLVSAQFDNGKSCDGKYTFYVYSYPTKNVASLNY
jgi:hypothetical protein